MYKYAYFKTHFIQDTLWIVYIISDIFLNTFINIEKYFTESCSEGSNNFFNLSIKSWAGLNEASPRLDEQCWVILKYIYCEIELYWHIKCTGRPKVVLGQRIWTLIFICLWNCLITLIYNKLYNNLTKCTGKSLNYKHTKST